jgi:hypothetical protein
VSVIEALLPPVIVCAAFVAIVIAVKRFADRESREERDER